MSQASHLIKGQDAEQRALLWLESQGLQLICRNHRCKQGEIDLIMQDQESLVFVEVRFRQGLDQALTSIKPAKQRRLIQAARHYLSNMRDLPPCRFDVIALAPDQSPQWIKAAFDVGS